MSVNNTWFWSVDELVAQLCHTRALFTAAAQSADNIPDCSALENELRTRNVTGKALLTTFDLDTLVVRNELRISRPSQRLALLAVVKMLQRESHEYKQQTTTTSARLPITETLPIAQKQKRAELHLGEPVRQALQKHHITNEFDHLLRWQDAAESDEVIDFAEEDNLGQEEHVDWVDVPQAEDGLDVALDSSEREDPPNKTHLSKEEVVDIINERINFYIDNWRPNVGVVPEEAVDYDVDMMWDKAEASGQRQILVQRYEKDHEYYSHRLDTLCDEIVKFAGNNAVSGYPINTWLKTNSKRS